MNAIFEQNLVEIFESFENGNNKKFTFVPEPPTHTLLGFSFQFLLKVDLNSVTYWSLSFLVSIKLIKMLPKLVSKCKDNKEASKCLKLISKWQIFYL